MKKALKMAPRSSQEENHEELDDENVIKIMIATDNHLGYGEKYPDRKDDSFIAFNEILQLAKDNDVDFVLLGGDLFHDNRPTRYCLKILTLYLTKN